MSFLSSPWQDCVPVVHQGHDGLLQGRHLGQGSRTGGSNSDYGESRRSKISDGGESRRSMLCNGGQLRRSKLSDGGGSRGNKIWHACRVATQSQIRIGTDLKETIFTFFAWTPFKLGGWPFSISKIWSEKLGMGTHFCHHWSIFCNKSFKKNRCT